MVDDLNKVTEELTNSATIIDKEMDNTIDRLATPVGATDNLENLKNDIQERNENIANEESQFTDRIPLPSSFIITPEVSKNGASATSAFLGLVASLSDERDENDLERSKKLSNTKNNIPSHQPRFELHHAEDPFNEFESNDLLLYSSFPFLFVLGRGLKTSGSLSPATTRHMLLQHSGCFSSCFRFIFLLFDQHQRHAASRIVASR